MDVSSKMKVVLVIALVVAVAVLVAAAFLFGTREAQAPQTETSREPAAEQEEFGHTENLGEDIPETNPFDAQTNPFSNIKTNPFAQ